MKRLIVKLLLATIAGSTVVGGVWMLKSLIQASQPPEFAVGLVGGIFWMFFMRQAWQLFKLELEDVKEEIEKYRASHDKQSTQEPI